MAIEKGPNETSGIPNAEDMPEGANERVVRECMESLVFGQETDFNIYASQLTQSEDGDIYVLQLERLKDAYMDIRSFLEAISDALLGGLGDEVGMVQRALLMMLTLHIDQNDRIATGKPFITHPIAVAQRVLDIYVSKDQDGIYIVPEAPEMYRVAQAVTAALLHDAVEDQADMLILKDTLQGHPAESQSPHRHKRSKALGGLASEFGDYIVRIIATLSSPVRPEVANGNQDEKNKEYERYVRGIFYESGTDPIVAIIKWADLQENVRINDLLQRARELQAEGKDDEAQRVFDFRKRLKAKYEPVLRMLQEFFARTQRAQKEHQLLSKIPMALQEIEELLRSHYR